LIDGVLTTYAAMGDREFVTVETDRGACVYELFECHWWDGRGPRIPRKMARLGDRPPFQSSATT